MSQKESTRQQLQALEAEINANPNKPELCYKYAKMLHKMGDNDKALVQISKFSARFPTDGRFTQLRVDVEQAQTPSTDHESKQAQLPTLAASNKPHDGSPSIVKSPALKNSRYAKNETESTPVARKALQAGPLAPLDSMPVLRPKEEPDPINFKPVNQNLLQKIDEGHKHNVKGNHSLPEPPRRKDFNQGDLSPHHGSESHNASHAASSAHPGANVSHSAAPHAKGGKLASLTPKDVEDITKIQSLHRGNKARKDVKEIKKAKESGGKIVAEKVPAVVPENVPTAVPTQPKAAFNAEDLKNIEKIQSVQRGRQARKQYGEMKKQASSVQLAGSDATVNIKPAIAEEDAYADDTAEVVAEAVAVVPEVQAPPLQAVAEPAPEQTAAESVVAAVEPVLAVAAPSIDTSEFDALEVKFKGFMADKEQLRAQWKKLDFNGNGNVSLAEIDKWIVEQYPLLNSKPALMRAYKKTTIKDGDGDAWVERKEFLALLRNLFYFNRIFKVFDAIDTGDDRRIDLAEFKKGCGRLNFLLSDEEAAAEFAKIDTNGGGQVLFDEFCAWIATKSIPVDGEVETDFTDNSSRPVESQDSQAEALVADVIENAVSEVVAAEPLAVQSEPSASV